MALFNDAMTLFSCLDLKYLHESMENGIQEVGKWEKQIAIIIWTLEPEGVPMYEHNKHCQCNAVAQSHTEKLVLVLAFVLLSRVGPTPSGGQPAAKVRPRLVREKNLGFDAVALSLLFAN